MIGYVPQLLSADPSLTGSENLFNFAKLYDVPRQERRKRIEQAKAMMAFGVLKALCYKVIVWVKPLHSCVH